MTRRGDGEGEGEEVEKRGVADKERGKRGLKVKRVGSEWTWRAGGGADGTVSLA